MMKKSTINCNGRRKDSLSYIEFMRGKYKNIYDTEYIKLLFSRFSKEELDNIDKYEFDELWKKIMDPYKKLLTQELKKSIKK